MYFHPKKQFTLCVGRETVFQPYTDDARSNYVATACTGLVNPEDGSTVFVSKAYLIKFTSGGGAARRYSQRAYQVTKVNRTRSFLSGLIARRIGTPLDEGLRRALLW